MLLVGVAHARLFTSHIECSFSEGWVREILDFCRSRAVSTHSRNAHRASRALRHNTM